MAAGEGFDKAGGVFVPLRGRPALQGKGSQLQAGNPTFSTRLQRGDVFCRKVQTHRLIEKLGGFRGGESQV